MKKPKVYIALSLSHVKSEEEKQTVRDILAWLASRFNIDLLQWAFDVVTWQPRPVENIYIFDRSQMFLADLVIVLFLSSDGSDGRGAELVLRCEAGLPIIAAAKEGVKISRFPLDCLQDFGVEVIRFEAFQELGPLIDSTLARINIVKRQEPIAVDSGFDLFDLSPSEKQ